MNDRTCVIRRPRRAWPPAARTVAAIAAAIAIAACGSSSPSSPTSGTQANPNQAHAQVNFARCMRSHRVSNFPDDLNIQSVPGINPSSPAFESAAKACDHLLPPKTPPPDPHPAQTRAKLVRLTTCLRALGYRSIPDPRTGPGPAAWSPESHRYGAYWGQGDYWIGIPTSIDAHGAAFTHALQTCHAGP